MNDVDNSHHRWSRPFYKVVGRMDREWRLALLPQPPWPYVLFPVGWIVQLLPVAGYPDVFSDVIPYCFGFASRGITQWVKVVTLNIEEGVETVVQV